MARAIVIVLDSLGVRAAADAEAYGDGGADTLGQSSRRARPGVRTATAARIR